MTIALEEKEDSEDGSNIVKTQLLKMIQKEKILSMWYNFY